MEDIRHQQSYAQAAVKPAFIEAQVTICDAFDFEIPEG